METTGTVERLTTAQVADALGVSPSFVRELVARGELVAYRLGRKTIRISRADLLKFLEARRKT